MCLSYQRIEAPRVDRLEMFITKKNVEWFRKNTSKQKLEFHNFISSFYHNKHEMILYCQSYSDTCSFSLLVSINAKAAGKHQV